MYNDSNFAEGYMVGRDSQNNCGGNGFFGDSAWWIIILLIFGWFGGYGNNGFGGLGGGANNYTSGFDLGKVATTNDVASGFANSAIFDRLNGIEDDINSVQSTLCQGFNGVNTAIMTSANATQQGIANLGYQLQACCCDIREAISGVNYNMAKNTCDILNAMNNNTRDIIDSQKNGTQAILSYLSAQELAQVRSERDAALAQLSQNSQTSTLLSALRPTPVPAYITCSPYASAYGLCPTQFNASNNCCGCNC